MVFDSRDRIHVFPFGTEILLDNDSQSSSHGADSKSILTFQGAMSFPELLQ
jgi:hypothetical protein